MTRTHFADGQILFREGDPADSVFRLLSGTVDVLRELDGYPILLGRVGVGQFVGEMGVVENLPRSATARAASEVEPEILRDALLRAGENEVIAGGTDSSFVFSVFIA